MSSTKRNSVAKRRTSATCQHDYHDNFAKKILMVLFSLLTVYVIVYVGVLTRNSIKEYRFIGKTDVPERMISLEATGVVEVKPDVATTLMGVRTQADTVEEAQTLNSEKMNQLIAQLQNVGIAQEDIQTMNYNVREVYEYTEEDGREVVGNEVSQQVSVTIRDVSKASQVLALAGEIGANTVGGLQFTLDDQSVYLAKAREEALQEITEKAVALSKTVGVRFGDIVSYNEWQDQSGVYPMARNYAYEDAAVSSQLAPTIEAGQEEVMLHVSVTYQIQ